MNITDRFLPLTASIVDNANGYVYVDIDLRREQDEDRLHNPCEAWILLAFSNN